MEPSISDDDVLDRANVLSALLLTADKDFGELVYRQNRITAGVVLLRLAGLSLERKADIVSSVFRDHGASMRQAFSVVSPGVLRIRSKGP